MYQDLPRIEKVWQSEETHSLSFPAQISALEENFGFKRDEHIHLLHSSGEQCKVRWVWRSWLMLILVEAKQRKFYAKYTRNGYPFWISPPVSSGVWDLRYICGSACLRVWALQGRKRVLRSSWAIIDDCKYWLGCCSVAVKQCRWK